MRLQMEILNSNPNYILVRPRRESSLPAGIIPYR
nr:MAG TPA: hypothetical protein [Caudoviricetes sp.]